MKEILTSLNPSIPELLPTGAIDELAIKHQKHPASISRMLRGMTGSNENVEALLKDAILIINNNEATRKPTLKAIKKLEKKIEQQPAA